MHAEISLNWPKYTYKTQELEGKRFIYDPQRKKYVSLTPEEWVRQHVLNYLHMDKGYPYGLILVESGLDFNSMRKRSDILVFDNKGESLILVECKSPNTKINQATLDQASRYNHQYKAPYLLITNGLIHFMYHINLVDGKTNRIKDLPFY